MFLSHRELAEMLQISTYTLAKWRRSGIGPEYFCCENTIRYDPQQVALWVEKQRCVRLANRGLRNRGIRVTPASEGVAMHG